MRKRLRILLRYGGSRCPYETGEWYRKAADQGLVQALNNLALLYMRGDGVPKDLVEAYKWFTIAVRGGVAAARGGQNEAALEMKPAELAQALRLAQQFKAKPTINPDEAPVVAMPMGGSRLPR